jgi:hypothetical protein
MTKAAMSREEWEVFKDWEAKLTGQLQVFETNFMSAQEITRELNKPAPDPTLPPDDELIQGMLDEMEEWQERQKAELLAFAERFGCRFVYLAAYLRHLDRKLEIIADVFGNNKVMMKETSTTE